MHLTNQDTFYQVYRLINKCWKETYLSVCRCYMWAVWNVTSLTMQLPSVLYWLLFHACTILMLRKYWWVFTWRRNQLWGDTNQLVTLYMFVFIVTVFNGGCIISFLYITHKMLLAPHHSNWCLESLPEGELGELSSLGNWDNSYIFQLSLLSLQYMDASIQCWKCDYWICSLARYFWSF